MESRFLGGDGITARGHIENATSPFPVDFQHNDFIHDSDTETSYVCRSFNLPYDVRGVAFESVWGDGHSSTSTGNLTC